MKKLKQVLKKKNTVCQDSPNNADEYTFNLKDGDIVITATDGLFDNLFRHEILSIVSEFKKCQNEFLIVSESQAKMLAINLV